MKINFYFIAVNYNGSEFTKQYIESIVNLEKDQKDTVNIIIVDNDSNIKDKNKLKRFGNKYDNLNIIWSKENVGYFRGLNKGIQSIEKIQNKILIIGNNDLTFDKQFLINFKKIAYTDNTLVIAPNIITRDGRLQNPHVVNKVSKLEKIKTRIYFSNYYIGQIFRVINQKIKKIFFKKSAIKKEYGQLIIKRGIGACYILTSNFFNHFNKLDDRIFMWGEEALLSNQIESVGGVTLYDPTIKITHYESASVKNIQSKDKYYMVKESYKVYRKYL